MTNVLHRNMLGVLLTIGLMFAMVAPAAYGEGALITAGTDSSAMVAVTAVSAELTISKEDAAALKATLDGLQAVVVSLDAYVKQLPKDGKEREMIAIKLNETLSLMSQSLASLNSSLSPATVVNKSNLAEVKTEGKAGLQAPIAENSTGKVVSAEPLVTSKSVDLKEKSGELAAAVSDAENKGLLSSIKSSLNSPPGLIVLVVFAMIFAVVVFMRVSSKKEAQTA